MEQLKNWLIVADMTPGDYPLLTNTRFFADKLKPETLHFIHVTPKLDLPTTVLNALDDLNQPLLNRLEKRMNEMCEKAFGTDYNWKVTVIEGNALSEIAKFSTSMKVDLILMNQRDEVAGQELSHKKIARKSFVSVLFLPEKPITTLSKVLFPVDFSSTSSIGMQIVIDWFNKIGFEKLSCQYVFKDADWYMDKLFYSAHEIEENLAKRKLLSVKLKDHADYKLKEFTNQFEDSVLKGKIERIVNRVAKGNLLWEIILNGVKKQQPDMLFIGAKGDSKSPLVLLGSVTEKLIQAGLNIPLMVVRDQKMPSALIKILMRI
ncbi:MAG: universal stress protein [Bacteroidota bacterium]